MATPEQREEGSSSHAPIVLSDDSESGSPGFADNEGGNLHDRPDSGRSPWRTEPVHDRVRGPCRNGSAHFTPQIALDSDDQHDTGAGRALVEDDAGEPSGPRTAPPRRWRETDGFGESSSSARGRASAGSMGGNAEAEEEDEEEDVDASMTGPSSRSSIRNIRREQGTADNPIVLSDDSPSHFQSHRPAGSAAGPSRAHNSGGDLRRDNWPQSPSSPWLLSSLFHGRDNPSRGHGHAAPPVPAPEPSSPSLPSSRYPLPQPPLPPPPRLPDSDQLDPTRQEGSTDIMLPRWQPDGEATYCPICCTQFSIFVRKHHCRKCGRVVCNACSPHRITIPYQYIVWPPGTPEMARYPSNTVFDAEGYADVRSLGGGERVRLCNPCVPDPNTTPPQTRGSQHKNPRSHARTHSNHGQQYRNEGRQPPPNRWTSYIEDAPDHDGLVRNRSATMHSGVPTSSRPPTSSSRSGSVQNRILSGTPPVYYPTSGPSSNRSQPYLSGSSRGYQSFVHQDFGDPAWAIQDNGYLAPLSSASSSSAMNRTLPPAPTQTFQQYLENFHPVQAGPPQQPPQPPQPQPQIAEEDECPVCHRELPSRELPDVDARREAHITDCIARHSAPSRSSVTSGSGLATPDNGGTPQHSVQQVTPPPPRRVGMFVYPATEKDCVDSAECSICLEEFEVGVRMGRLECLCRFHKDCIDAWWERNPGRCPMHHHDGLGY